MLFFLPELKYVFLLFIVMGYFTNGFFQGDGHLSVVCSTTASTLAVLVETKISFSKDTVNIMPGSVGEKETRLTLDCVAVKTGKLEVRCIGLLLIFFYM